VVTDDDGRQDLIRGVVTDRRMGRHKGQDHPLVPDLLVAELKRLKPRDTIEQRILWYGRRWAAKEYWHRATRKRLKALADSLGPPNGHGRLFITRSQVFARRDPVDLFLAAMAWGYGTNGYGPWRTAQIVNPEGRNREASIRGMVDASRRAWDPDKPEALLRAWESGAGKIRGLGPAFASKVAYFALYAPDKGTGPLIVDRNTTWSVWALGDIWDSRYSSAKYGAYVRWCERWAVKLGRHSHDVERALFSLGPEVRDLA